MALSKYLPSFLSAGLLLGLDELARGGKLRPRHLLIALQHPYRRRLAVLNAILMSLFLFEALLATAIYDWRAADMMLLGRWHPELITREFKLVIFPVGVALGTLLILAPPLLLWRPLSPLGALKANMRAVAADPAPFALLALATGGWVACTAITNWTVWLLLPLYPWCTATAYAVYRDVTTRGVA